PHCGSVTRDTEYRVVTVRDDRRRGARSVVAAKLNLGNRGHRVQPRRALMKARLLSAGVRVGLPIPGRFPGRTLSSSRAGPPAFRSSATASSIELRSLVDAAYRYPSARAVAAT